MLAHVDDLDWKVVGEGPVENLSPEHLGQDDGGDLAEVETILVKLRQEAQEHVQILVLPLHALHALHYFPLPLLVFALPILDLGPDLIEILFDGVVAVLGEVVVEPLVGVNILDVDCFYGIVLEVVVGLRGNRLLDHTFYLLVCELLILGHDHQF